MVYVLVEPRANKFDPYWKGPMLIRRILDKNRAVLDIGDGKEKTVHQDKLKLAFTQMEPLED